MFSQDSLIALLQAHCIGDSAAPWANRESHRGIQPQALSNFPEGASAVLGVGNTRSNLGTPKTN